MEGIAANMATQLGAVGLLIISLIWFARYMFVYFMKQQSQSYEDNKDLETAFRDYLIIQAKEHHEIIKANTEAISQMLSFFDKQFGEYMQSRIKSHDRLSDNIEQFINEIRNNL